MQQGRNPEITCGKQEIQTLIFRGISYFHHQNSALPEETTERNQREKRDPEEAEKDLRDQRDEKDQRIKRTRDQRDRPERPERARRDLEHQFFFEFWNEKLTLKGEGGEGTGPKPRQPNQK